MLEDDLTGTLKLLRAYRGEERLEQDIAAVAHAEAYVDDPLKATMVRSSARSHAEDVFGVAEAFA